MGQLTNTRHSDGAPDPDGVLKTVVRIKTRHYHNLDLNRPDPIVFIPLAVDTAGRLYDDFVCFLFRFLRVSCFSHLKGDVGLIKSKASAMWISIPLDLSSRSFIPLSPRLV